MTELIQASPSDLAELLDSKTQIELLATTMDLTHKQLEMDSLWDISLADLARAYGSDSPGVYKDDFNEFYAKTKSRSSAREKANNLRLRRHRSSLARLAAHMAVRNQVMLFANPGIDEETHTAAFFGMLANTLSISTVLAPSPPICDENGCRAGCYWVHQSKTQEEPKSGADFGIVTDLNITCAKLTLFQAKRPKTPEGFGDLAYGHTVRYGRPTEPTSQTALEQKAALDKIEGLIREGKNIREVKRHISKDEWEAAIKTGSLSLFSGAQSYQQITAFLATALRGENEGRVGHHGWCFYVQWPHGARAAPWTAPINDVLIADDRVAKGLNQTPFDEILSLALSSVDIDYGVIIAKTKLKDFACKISSLMPGITWGVMSDSEEGAVALASEIGVTGYRKTNIPQVAPEPISPNPARRSKPPSLSR